MKPALWLIAALPLVAQPPKLLINAQVDTKSAASGLEQTLRSLIPAQTQPAWIGHLSATPATTSWPAGR